MNKTPKTRLDRYGSLYDMFIKMIVRANDDNAYFISIGLPYHQVEYEFDKDYIPIFFLVNNNWQQVFIIPI